MLVSADRQHIENETVNIRTAASEMMRHKFCELTPLQGREIANAILAIERATSRLESVAMDILR